MSQVCHLKFYRVYYFTLSREWKVIFFLLNLVKGELEEEEDYELEEEEIMRLKII
jgi:hypothetical protein